MANFHLFAADVNGRRNYKHKIPRAKGTGGMRMLSCKSTWEVAAQSAMGATVSHKVFPSRNMDDNSNCEAGVIVRDQPGKM
jgi:hypothetical protein